MAVVRPRQPRGSRTVAVLAVLLCVLVSGCSGITPGGELRNNREEGPEKGIFSGQDGEFVLYGPATEKAPDKAGAQPKATP